SLSVQGHGSGQSVGPHQALGARVIRDGLAALRLLFLFPAMARHPALAARFPRLLRRPLVSGPFLMRGLAALASDFALLASIHRRKSRFPFGTGPPPAPVLVSLLPGRLHVRARMVGLPLVWQAGSLNPHEIKALKKT